MDLRGIWEAFFDNPSDEEYEYFPLEREHHIKIQHYFENIVSAYTLTDFKSHFRVEKHTYERLVQDLGQRLYREQGAQKMSPEKQIAITLWSFGNQEVYRSVADRFGVSKDTVWRCVFEVAMLLTQDAQRYIKWPEPHEMIRSERQFRELHDLPGVIGAIDGSHLPISAPKENPENYINRKGYHSIILQGICDCNLKFIDVFTGICGSVHDARVWRLSDIETLIAQDVNRYFQNQYHLLADSAYPLSTYMLTPYRDNGHLTNAQRRFNTIHSRTRVVIERAFGILKGRFRKLKYIYMYNTEMIPLVILACCILHNICIENEDAFIDDDALDEIENNIDAMENNIEFINGAEKRDIISYNML